MITAEKWQKIKEIFQTVTELDVDKRLAYLDLICQDPEIRKEVDILVKSFQKIENKSFLTNGVLTKITKEAKKVDKNAATIIETDPSSKVLEQPLNQQKSSREKENIESLIGKTFAEKYYVEKILGQGGTSIVYLVRDTWLNKPRAIKILLQNLQKRLDLQTRLIREAKATQKVKHPYLITTYEINRTTDDQLYLVMEYIEGVNLKQKINEQKNFSPKEAFHLLRPVLEALEAVHSANIIHRDIKPDNILIGKDENDNNVIKLTDLGTAKFYDISKLATSETQLAALPLTATGTLIGTPYYMSPEQWREKPRDIKDNKWKIDTRTDIYSVGIILYEMISGKKPFDNSNLFALSREHISKIATPLNQLIPSVTEKFAEVIAKAMAKDRNDRFQTIRELREDLKNVLN